MSHLCTILLYMVEPHRVGSPGKKNNPSGFGKICCLQCLVWEPMDLTYPIGSVHGIFTYIWLMFMVKVGQYAIHGLVGIWFKEVEFSLTKPQVFLRVFVVPGPEREWIIGYQVIHCDLFGMVKWPLHRLSDLQIMDKKGHFESPGT